MFNTYLQKVFAKAKTGVAGERTYYPVLEELLKKYCEGSEIIIEAKRSAVGIPDFKVENAKKLLVGYIEAKDLGRDLDKLSKTEQDQLEKYKKEYPKLIVTNFIEFRLFANGDLVDSVIITQPITLKIGIPALDNEGRIKGIFERFFSTTIPSVYTSKHLSELLAHKTRVLRGLILEEIDLTNDEESETEKLLKTFRETLKPDMTPELFSDMYAQTITFGLFVARINSDHQEFTRSTAHKLIPHTIPLLKKVFWILSGQDVPQHIEWQVDEIAEILGNTNIEKITEEFFSHGTGRDPIVHFYETFLSEYDSSQREQLGVYYTPPPVVSFITRSLNIILKTHLKKREGFADTSVITLDPAAGTLTFPAQAITLAKVEFEKNHGSGGWGSLVRNHILKNFYAFELLMAPYAVGHLKISLLLKELGYQMSQDERFQLYLTNTLDMSKFHPQEAILAEELSQESEKAFDIKDNVPVWVIMGNPPYSVSSSNIIKEDTELFKVYETYKEIVRTEETNIQPLSDDYIKFIAFAHWKILKAGRGVVGLITNNTYIEGMIHRDMRRKLFNDFNKIYVLNLHGNAINKERLPNGIRNDENVFGIKKGVAILLMIKREEGSDHQVYYKDLWGDREEKYKYLNIRSVEDTDWEEVNIINFQEKFNKTKWGKKYSKGLYFFSPRLAHNAIKYGNMFGLDEIFKDFTAGIVTGKDNVLTDINEYSLKVRMSQILNKGVNKKEIEDLYDLNNSAGKKILNNTSALEFDISTIKKYQYRPFDNRTIYYEPKFIERSRKELFLKVPNEILGLAVSRLSANDNFSNAFPVDSLFDYKLADNTRGSYFFPLFLGQSPYPKQNPLFETENGINFSPEFINFLNDKYKKISFIDVFYYIYAILYSNIYRETYTQLLRVDFPRIPFSNDTHALQQIAILGKELVDLHLLKSAVLNTLISHYEGQGDDCVEKRDYHEDTNRLYINNSQYFDKVSPEVWNFFIGGYQVLDNWLKYRNGKVLSLEDQLYFRKIITALSGTLEIQKKIDKLYPDIEKSINKEVKEYK